MNLHIIVIGKLKDQNILSLEKEYLKRLTCLKIKITELKGHSENIKKEGEAILKSAHTLCKGQPHLIFLYEKGEQKKSENFSTWLFETLKLYPDKVVLIIGGAAGHAEHILNQADQLISLGKLTFPHKIARLILIEQLYRAESIFKGHPYHK